MKNVGTRFECYESDKMGHDKQQAILLTVGEGYPKFNRFGLEQVNDFLTLSVLGAGSFNADMQRFDFWSVSGQNGEQYSKPLKVILCKFFTCAIVGNKRQLGDIFRHFVQIQLFETAQALHGPYICIEDSSAFRRDEDQMGNGGVGGEQGRPGKL